MPKTPWPGSQTPTPREIQAANRRLIMAMKRHKDAKRRLVRAESELREARATVRRLIDLLTQGPSVAPAAGPRCEDCMAVLGRNPHCVTCQAHGVLLTPDAGTPA